MRPTLSPGQTVIVRATASYRLGDIVLIETGRNGYVLHRLLALSGPLLLHAGDAPGALASLTHRRHLIGRADLPTHRPSIRRRLRGIGQALTTIEYRELFRA